MGLFNKLLGNAGEVDSLNLNKEYASILIDTEEIEVGFSLFRDVFMFTNKRLILVDKQGLTGKKIDYLSLPYRSITRYSIETAGHLELDAELKIWISSEENPSICKKFTKSVNVYEVQKVLSTHVLK
ncbi:PH domain-containing protein [Chishuiella sp.]|uniref:PH domain-containing protein n=1 Tax=Chishuiella sp. TaxID=1969467 RepID=UPI0028A63CE3|nr:PH domain-containing protein [Chishuiella sp.]